MRLDGIVTFKTALISSFGGGGGVAALRLYFYLEAIVRGRGHQIGVGRRLT